MAFSVDLTENEVPEEIEYQDDEDNDDDMYDREFA
jgi:hypothetical protein